MLADTHFLTSFDRMKLLALVAILNFKCAYLFAKKKPNQELS